MPPPGFGPPGYSSDHIPQNYMNKRPVPAGADTNTRAYLIFFSYLGTCVLLTLFVVQKLFKNYTVLSKSTTARPPPRRHVLALVILAASSLFFTWYYMIQYFQVSYRIWLMWRSYYELTPDKRHWGLWLKETSLFKEAWEVAIVGYSRYWWTHQIFFFACGLGLFLEQKGVRRNIKHTWAFMLIGQIVAISFATNLFLLALLLSPPAPPSPSSSEAHKRKWLGPIISFLTIIASEYPAYLLADPYYWDNKDFMRVLLTPHVVLMILPVLRAFIPARYFADDNAEFVESIYQYLWVALGFGGGLLWFKTASAAYNYSGVYGMSNVLLEHPAVSSVGFDVIFCWITWFVWWRLQRNGINDYLETKKETDEDSWEGTGTTVSSGDLGGAVRRR